MLVSQSVTGGGNAESRVSIIELTALRTSPEGVLRADGAVQAAGNWTFVVVTDRAEVDEQIARTFKATGAVSEAEGDQWGGRPLAFSQRVLLEDDLGEEQVCPFGGRGSGMRLD